MVTEAFPRLQMHGTRSITVVLVGALHLLVLWVFWRVRVEVAEEPELFAHLTFFTLQAQAQAQAPADASARDSAKSIVLSHTPQVQPPRLPSMARPAPLLPIAPQTAGKSEPRIDWSDEAGQVAATVLDREQEDARRRDAFVGRVRRDRKLTATPDPRAGFRWDYAATHRLDTSSGMPVWHINDRCAMPLIFPLFAACAIGHIDAHGDLFDGMSEKHAGIPPAQDPPM